MIWVITGNREGHPLLFAVLDSLVRQLGRPELVVLGDASGVDNAAHVWCHRNGVEHEVCYADWYPDDCDGLDLLAGHKRNGVMLDTGGLGALVVGFPVGASPGTRDCLRQARMRGMRFVCFEG